MKINVKLGVQAGKVGAGVTGQLLKTFNASATAEDIDTGVEFGVDFSIGEAFKFLDGMIKRKDLFKSEPSVSEKQYHAEVKDHAQTRAKLNEQYKENHELKCALYEIQSDISMLKEDKPRVNLRKNGLTFEELMHAIFLNK